ncbi:hypothetical protein CspHIS471_0310950 [Cutaneotrichosporon sp. HIS471]|nr:hypothetical protein CspHIS471_0310950 [Cutaneotrichosporon sp. HIS471]
MACIAQVYQGTYLARPAHIISPPDLIDRAVNVYTKATSNMKLWENTLIALPHNPEYPIGSPNAIDPNTISFVDLTAIPAGSPVPVFPNLRAVHVRPDSAFVPAPVVIHTIQARAGENWGINPGLIPRVYNMEAYRRIQRVVCIVRADTGTDIAASTMDIHEWIDVLSSLGSAVTREKDPGDKDRPPPLKLVLRILPASIQPLPLPSNWDVNYSALAQLGIAVGAHLPDVKLYLDGPEMWDMEWLGFNFFAQHPDYHAAYEHIATMVGKKQIGTWKVVEERVGYDKWLERKLIGHIAALRQGEYEKGVRAEGLWDFEASRQ